MLFGECVSRVNDSSRVDGWTIVKLSVRGKSKCVREENDVMGEWKAISCWEAKRVEREVTL